MDIFSVEYCQCRSSAESRNEGVNIFYSYHRFSTFFSEVLLPFAICSFPLRTRIDSRRIVCPGFKVRPRARGYAAAPQSNSVCLDKCTDRHSRRCARTKANSRIEANMFILNSRLPVFSRTDSMYAGDFANFGVSQSFAIAILRVK